MREKDIKTIWAKLNKELHQPRRTIIIRLLILLLFLVHGLMPIRAQNGEVVVFSENWDESYDLEPWSPNFTSGWFSLNPKNQIVSQSNKGNVLKVNFATGDIGGDAGVGNYRIYLDSLYKELYFSWEYYLQPGFDYGFADTDGGGKFFGGFSGGNYTHVPVQPSDTSVGWTYFMLFADGDYYTYPYFYNSDYENGTPLGNYIAPIVKGEWREVTIRLKVNDPNTENGIIEMFDNGKLVFKKSDYQMTSPNHPEWRIDALLLDVFFGGISPCPTDQYAMFDNMVAWYYPKTSSMFRSGNSESGRTVYAPRVSNYHPNVPNKFTETVYTDARGTISSHCGFEMPIIHENDLETSTIEISNASYISIDVSKYADNGSSYDGSRQILNIYSGKGNNKSLVKSFNQYTTIPTQFDISGNTATIEWQSGGGDRRGFKLTYTSDGTGSGKNFTCGNFTASQLGAFPTTNPVTPTPPNANTPVSPSNLQTTSVTTNSISLKWNDNSSNESLFEIERMGPSSNLRKTTKVNANTTTYSDIGLETNATYTYWIRAYNASGGYSSYSASVQAKTLNLTGPINAPSNLKSTEFTEKSISISWNDNSSNESGFLITRTLAMNPDSTVNIWVEANATNFTDDSLASNTTYIYTVKAVNNGGSSASSNKNVTSTLSVVETKRVKDGLIAYYNFAYDPDYIVRDLSGFNNPLNLKILQPSAVNWNENNRLEILSGTSVVSTASASKIISEIKRTGEITMECWIKPAEPDLSSSSRVISLALNDAEVGFVLDQNYSTLENEKSLNYSVRVQTESTNKSGYPEIAQLKDIAYLNMQHVAYIRDTIGNETLYVNGEKLAEGFRPSDFSTWSNSFYLRLGNEKDLAHPWKGTFYSLAIYNKALSYGEIHKNYTLGPCDNIKSKGQDFTVKVYPNPISDLATIEILPVETQDYIPLTIIRVLDLYGKIHSQTIMFNPNEQYQTTLDVKNFAKGIYFLQIISGQNQKTTKLIVQ